MPEDGHRSVRRYLLCLTNKATVEKIGLSRTVAAVSARPFHSRSFESGAPTLATPSQRVLDFLLRTLERPEDNQTAWQDSCQGLAASGRACKNVQFSMGWTPS